MLVLAGVNISTKKIRFRLPEFFRLPTKRLTLMQTGKIKRQLPAGRGSLEFSEIDLLGSRVEVQAMDIDRPLPKTHGKQ